MTPLQRSLLIASTAMRGGDGWAVLVFLLLLPLLLAFTLVWYLAKGISALISRSVGSGD